MKIAIIGLSSLTQKLVEDISREKEQLFLFYKEEYISKEYLNFQDLEMIPVTEYNRDFISNPKLLDSDVALILGEDDGENMLIATFLSKVYLGDIYLRLEDPTLARIAKENKETLGFSYIINAPQVLRDHVVKLYYDDVGVPTESFDEFGLSICRIRIDKGDSSFIRRRIKDVVYLEGLVVIGIQRERDIIVPDGNTVINEGDQLYLIGSKKSIKQFKSHYSKVEIGENMPEEMKRFIIFGDTDYALAVGNGLLRRGGDVVIVGKDKEKIKKMRNRLPDAQFEVGDGRDRNLQLSLEVDRADGVIALSHDEGENVLCGLVAYQLGQKNVSIVIDTRDLLTALSIDYFTAIFHMDYIIAQQLEHRLTGPKELSLHLVPGLIDVYEITLAPEAEVVGKYLGDLDLQKGFLLGGIKREGEATIIPRGDTKLEAYDRVLIFALSEVAQDIRKFIKIDTNKSLLTELLSLY